MSILLRKILLTVDVGALFKTEKSTVHLPKIGNGASKFALRFVLFLKPAAT